VTLHVGMGTFQPVRVEEVTEHQMHPEAYEVSPPAAASLNRAIGEGRRIVAVGTTSVRVLEHCARAGSVHAAAARPGSSSIPLGEFRAVSAMVTNFHLPKSTLLMLVSAFAGTDYVLGAYKLAVEEDTVSTAMATPC